MFRKLALALGATAVIGAAALTPTSASAHWHGPRSTGPWLGLSASASLRRRPIYRVRLLLR